MLKIAVIFALNVAIMAVDTTLNDSPQTYFEWKIAKFFDLPTKDAYRVQSPQFSFANTKWHLQIYTNGSTLDHSRGFINMYLCLVDPIADRHVSFSMGIKKPNGTVFIGFKNEIVFNKLRTTSGRKKLLSRSTLLRSKGTVAPDGTLVVVCKARIVNSTGIASQYTSNGIGNLSADFKELYTSKRFSDIKLIVKEREFPAHKNVLSCRLTTFGSMGENIPDKFEITDCDPDSFEEFLLYIYTGKLVTVPYEKTKNLYLTAHKYNLTELKDECARSISDNDLNLVSFYDILDFANLHKDNILLTAVTDFLIKNAKIIISTEKWQTFLTNNPLQVNKLFLSYLEKNV